METKKKDSPTSNAYSNVVEEEEVTQSRTVMIQMFLKGDTPGPYADKKGPIQWHMLLLFDGVTLVDIIWENEKTVEYHWNKVNLLDSYHQAQLTDKPLIILLRTAGGKPGKDPDPLAHPDNRAGGTIDLMPLVMGADAVNCKVRLLSATGEEYGCKVKFFGTAVGLPMPESNLVPFVITLISAHCLPPIKSDTVFISAIGLDGLMKFENIAFNFGMSLSGPTATKLLWAGAATGGQMLNSHYSVPDDDKFIPYDVEINNNEQCVNIYWNIVKRVLVDPDALKRRLANSFAFEVAGVPRQVKGKIETRGRYMALIDARVLLEPAQTTLITYAKLQNFNEEELPEGIGPLLNIPPASQKSSPRGKSPESTILTDLLGHIPCVLIKFDLREPLVPKTPLPELFQGIGFPPPETRLPLNELYIDPPPEDPSVDVRKIRNERGALAVHKELSSLACRGAVPMNQGIKKTAANRLLTRVRTMLRQFSPGECSYIEWQDTVTGQHAAARRAVTASFRDQPPPKRPGGVLSSARARMAGDLRIAAKHVEANIETCNKHPRVLLSKALRCLEARNDMEASFFILRAIDSQTRNRFLLWILGGLKFDKGVEAIEVAKSAFRIAVKGDYSDGIACTVGWAALHSLYHFEGNQYGAFVAARKMRKSHELKSDWRQFYQQWLDTSGEEEIYWVPGVILNENPFVIAAALFLCLRCYKFSELLLKCMEKECATRGSRHGLKPRITADVYYLRGVSLLLRRQVDTALQVVETGIKEFGPSPMMSQMRATCLMAARSEWDEDCALALHEAERAGSEICSALLLQAALKGMKTDVEGALQRAARAHKATPCAHTALALARILARKGEVAEAEKWAAAAVKLEPLLADAWAVLALLAMGDRDVERARAMLRTARQVGPVSPDIEKQLKKVMSVVKIDTMCDSMMKNLCFCEYLDPTVD